MSYRGRRRAEGIDILNLDSLVDVITNTNGMLLMLAIFTVLLALGKTYDAGFPLARAPGKNAIFFECVGNKIVHVGNSDRFSGNYHVTPIGRSQLIALKDGYQAYSAADLDVPGSPFWQVIDRIDPETEYAAFIVRPDSFEVYRAVRDVLQSRSIDAGWEPWQTNSPIVFGRGGRQISEQ